MRRFEIQSIEGIGYLIFEKLSDERTRRVGDLYQNIKQAQDFIGAGDNDEIRLLHHCAYEEMINGEETNLDIELPLASRAMA